VIKYEQHLQQQKDPHCVSHGFASLTLPFVQLPFPVKLHDMLEAMATNGSQHVVSWQPHGKAFRVHQPEVFARTIMTEYFKQTKYKSFQRQLNLYGFIRVNKGMDKGAYYHSLFIQNKKPMSLRMIREKVKGAGNSQRCGIEDPKIEDPNFYKETVSSMEHQHPPYYNFNKETSRYVTTMVTPDVAPMSSMADFSGATAKKNTYSTTGDVVGSVVKEHLEEGDEVFFEGKRFHFVEPSMPTLSVEDFFSSVTARGPVVIMPRCA
jgi:hypothetical protein